MLEVLSWPPEASSPWTSMQYRAFPSYTQFRIHAAIDKIAPICSSGTRIMLWSTERQLEPRGAQPLALVNKFVVPYSSCTPSQTAPKTCCKNTQVLQAFFPSLRTGDLTSKPKPNSYFYLSLIKYLFS